MDEQQPLGASGVANAESGAARDEAGGIRDMEAGAGVASRAVLSHGSGHPLHSGAVCPCSSEPSRGVEVLNVGRRQHPGEAADHSLGHCRHLDGLSSSAPGTSVFTVSDPVPGGPGVYTPGNSVHSGSVSLDSCKPSESQLRGILKNNSPVLTENHPATERKKSQHWDEMNILATYHPTNKDYGFMKVDEPSTPYHRLQDSDEDLSSESSKVVTPGMLTERLAAMDNFHPKVRQYGDNRSSESPDSFSKTNSSDFEKRRKSHYNEGKFLKAQKNLSLDNNKSSSGVPTLQVSRAAPESLRGPRHRGAQGSNCEEKNQGGSEGAGTTSSLTSPTGPVLPP